MITIKREITPHSQQVIGYVNDRTIIKVGKYTDIDEWIVSHAASLPVCLEEAIEYVECFQQVFHGLHSLTPL
jgi:hypothetical protein